MEIILKNNIKFVGFNSSKILKETILDFIYNSKSDKILYKGSPTEVNYKLLKKILPLDQIKFDENQKSINKFVEISDDRNIREVYQDLLNVVNCDYCLIHKI